MISVLNPITTTAASDCLAGKQPHHQSYQSAAGIRRSRAIRREPIRRPVPKLALSDRPHDWGKVRRFPGERQATAWISLFTSFSGWFTAVPPHRHPPLGNGTKAADWSPAGLRRAPLRSRFVPRGLSARSPRRKIAVSVQFLRPW